MHGLRTAVRFTSDAVIGMNATLETAELQFATLTGSTTRARDIVEGLFDFAKRTPFETGPIIEASRIMQTFGGDALNTTENLMLIGDAAAGTTAPINELGMWTGRLFAALQGGQPIGEATLRLMELGVVTPQVVQKMRDMRDAGASGTETFQFFQEQLGRFSGAMEAQAETWDGLTSTLQDSVDLLLAEAFKPLFDAMKVSVGQLNDWVDQLSDSGAAVVAVADAIHTVLSAFDFLLRVVDLTQTAFRAFQTVFNDALALLLRGGILVLQVAVAYEKLNSVIDFMNRETHQKNIAALEQEIFVREQQIAALNDLSQEQIDASIETGNAITAVREHIRQLGDRIDEYKTQSDGATASTTAAADSMEDFGVSAGSGGGAKGRTGAEKTLGGLTITVRNARDAIQELITTQGLSTFGWQSFNAELLRANQLLTDQIGLIPTVQQRHAGLMNEMMGGESGPGFFSSVFGSDMGGLNAIFQRAFEGGGGLGGAIQSFATGALSKALNFVPIVGPLLSNFAGAFVSGFKRLFGGVGGFFKDLFGGPSEVELQGRETANAWIDAVISTTNISSDRISKAVSEGWDPRLAEFALSAQDVWTAAGSTAEAAMSWTQQFFDAIKQGPGAVQPLIDEFQRMQTSVQDVGAELDHALRPRAFQVDFSQWDRDRPMVGGMIREGTTSFVTGAGHGQAVSFQVAHRGGMIRGYNAGGLVDDVPAMLQRGEFVMSRPAVSRIGAGTLAAMNAGASNAGTLNVNVNGAIVSDPRTARFLAAAVQREVRSALQMRRQVS